MKLFSRMIPVALLGLSVLAAAQIVNVSYLAILSGTGKGKATWKTNDKIGEPQAELQVEGEGQARDTVLAVTFGSNAPFTVVTSDSGSFTYHLTYHTADRPVVHLGDLVTVSNSAGQIVLSGTLQPN